MSKFHIEYIATKPKSKKTDETKITKECNHENNRRDGECSFMACPIHFTDSEYQAGKESCKFRVAKKEIEGGMKEMVEFIMENGLGKDGKKLSEDEVLEIVESLDKEELKKLTIAEAEEQTEINRKLNEDKLELAGTLEEEGLLSDQDKEWLDKEGLVRCGNCGSHNEPENRECWYCGAVMKQYNEEEISDELIQYTIIHKDGRTEHKWLTQAEYDELWKYGTTIKNIKVE